MEKLLPVLQKYGALAKRYSVIICALVFGGAYAFLIITAGQQTSREPAKAEATNSSIKLDDSLAQQLLELEDTNTEVKRIFNEARDNPFDE